MIFKDIHCLHNRIITIFDFQWNSFFLYISNFVYFISIDLVKKTLSSLTLFFVDDNDEYIFVYVVNKSKATNLLKKNWNFYHWRKKIFMCRWYLSFNRMIDILSSDRLEILIIFLKWFPNKKILLPPNLQLQWHQSNNNKKQLVFD